MHIDDPSVSRRHVLVSFGNARWRISDQQSGNGVFVEDRRVDSVSIDSGLTIRLGASGPSLEFQVESPHQPAVEAAAVRRVPSETMIVAERYFGSGPGDEVVGGRTMMIRKAFHKVQTRQKRTYQAIVAVLVVVALGAGGFAWYGQRQLARQAALAEDLFYQMKAHDVEIANLERQLLASKSPDSKSQVEAYLARRRQMQTAYEQFISGLNLYDHPLTPQEQLILRVTRLFGECEMAAPPEYLAEVNSYIRKWQTTGRYATAVNRAHEMGYAKRIIEEFEQQDLPAQFFYLATAGKQLRRGGQRTADTLRDRQGHVAVRASHGRAVRHESRTARGLSARRSCRRSPQMGDRNARRRRLHQRHLRDRRASVGAAGDGGYNWGENRVINLLRTMPANPKERNFWKVLERHRNQVPKETYDYVLSIVSAAVIGENPRALRLQLRQSAGGRRTPVRNLKTESGISSGSSRCSNRCWTDVSRQTCTGIRDTRSRSRSTSTRFR